MDPGNALEIDSIEGTVDYGVAFSVIERSSPWSGGFLIEALRSNAQGLQSLRRSRKAAITVRKPNAPVAGVLDHVEVTVVWPQ